MTINTRPRNCVGRAVAQLNPIVGDVAGNLEKGAQNARARRRSDGADIVAFSELFIAGYPPEDLVLKPAFPARCRAAPLRPCEPAAGGPTRTHRFAFFLGGEALRMPMRCSPAGRIEAIRYKLGVPNYGVFDEKRVFGLGAEFRAW